MVDEKQVQEADAAITQAVGAFVSEFELMWGRWENVAPAYVIESALLELCTELSVLAADIKIVAGPSTVKLLDALAAYRDSELTTADAALPPDRWWSPPRRKRLTSCPRPLIADRGPLQLGRDELGRRFRSGAGTAGCAEKKKGDAGSRWRQARSKLA